jgi:hypothetical protein
MMPPSMLPQQDGPAAGTDGVFWNGVTLLFGVWMNRLRGQLLMVPNGLGHILLFRYTQEWFRLGEKPGYITRKRYFLDDGIQKDT